MTLFQIRSFLYELWYPPNPLHTTPPTKLKSTRHTPMVVTAYKSQFLPNQSIPFSKKIRWTSRSINSLDKPLDQYSGLWRLSFTRLFQSLLYSLKILKNLVNLKKWIWRYWRSILGMTSFYSYKFWVDSLQIWFFFSQFVF